MKGIKIYIFINMFLLSLLFRCSTLVAKDPPVYKGAFSNKAVSGYDTVAYFTEGKPVKGDPKITSNYNGAVWQFATITNKEKFDANPEQFIPQYGGYCAWAVSENYTASANPNNWKIIDGKLYLNYNTEVQKIWEKDIPSLINKANKNWPSVLNK